MSEIWTHLRRHQLRALAGSLADLVRDVLSRYSRLGGSQFAAAISYRALFSLVPLATFAATILAEVLSSSSANRQDFVSAIAEQLGLSANGTARLDALIRAVPPPWSLAGLAALGLALWGATGVMYSIQKALAIVFNGGASRGLIRGRLVSVLLVLGALGLVLLAVIVSMLENVRPEREQGRWRRSRLATDRIRDPPRRCGACGDGLPSLRTLYHYLPHHRPGWRAALLGAAVAALGHQAVQLSLGWYLSGPADFTKVYGSASAIFAFLFSVYLSASAFVIGAILTAVLDEQLRTPK
jgi:YihY family inner membrane protein